MTVTAYAGVFDTSHQGTALPLPTLGKKIFEDEFSYLSIADSGGDAEANWYAPGHTKLGTGALATFDNRKAIYQSEGCLVLDTLNPSSSGVGGTDVNVRTVNDKGEGFTFTNGYVGVQALLPSANGCHFGLWLLSNPDADGHSEYDALEAYGGATQGKFSVNAHFWPVGHSVVSPPSHWTAPNPDLLKSFHEYGALLTPTYFATYLDRKEVCRVPRLPQAVVPHSILISNFTDANRKDGYTPSTLRVGSVVVYGK